MRRRASQVTIDPEQAALAMQWAQNQNNAAAAMMQQSWQQQQQLFAQQQQQSQQSQQTWQASTGMLQRSVTTNLEHSLSTAVGSSPGLFGAPANGSGNVQTMMRDRPSLGGNVMFALQQQQQQQRTAHMGQMQHMQAPMSGGSSLLADPLSAAMTALSSSSAQVGRAGGLQQAPMQQPQVPEPSRNRPQRASTLTFIDGKWQSGL